MHFSLNLLLQNLEDKRKIPIFAAEYPVVPAYAYLGVRVFIYPTLFDYTATLHSGTRLKFASFTTIGQYLIAKIQNNFETQKVSNKNV